MTGGGWTDYDTLAAGAEMPDADGDEAPPDTEAKLGLWPDPKVEDSPVVPLGFDGARVVFAMPEGTIRSELASKIGGMLRTDIYACAAGAAFMTAWKDSDDKFQQLPAVQWFVRKCRAEGMFDRRRAQRMIGVWPGDAGAVVLHKGDSIWSFRADFKLVRGSISDSHRAKRGPLYILQPATPMPAHPGARAEDGAWIRTRLDLWRFEDIGAHGLTGADVVLGWLMAAMLGAVPSFRAHLLLFALQGSGKTTFLNFCEALTSALGVEVISSFTEPGLRQDLAGMARPAIIDEAEASDGQSGPGPVELVLKLLTLMATGAGAQRKSGGLDGVAVTQTAVGAVMVAAINPPRVEPALASRMAEIRLLPLNTPAPPGKSFPGLATDAELACLIEQVRALSPLLLWRVLTSAARFKADVAAVKAAMTARGETPRTADLIATLAAGRRLALEDAPLDEAGAGREADRWRPLLSEREATQAVSNSGVDAFRFLMASDSGKHHHDRRLTVGEVVEMAIKHVAGSPGRDDQEAVLKPLGIRLEADDEGVWHLVVCHNHPWLVRLFAKSKWPDYCRTLGYLNELLKPYAVKPWKALRYGVGIKQRGLGVPLSPLLESTDRNAGVAQRSTERSGEDVEWT